MNKRDKKEKKCICGGLHELGFNLHAMNCPMYGKEINKAVDVNKPPKFVDKSKMNVNKPDKTTAGWSKILDEIRKEGEMEGGEKLIGSTPTTVMPWGEKMEYFEFKSPEDLQKGMAWFNSEADRLIKESREELVREIRTKIFEFAELGKDDIDVMKGANLYHRIVIYLYSLSKLTEYKNDYLDYDGEQE